MVLSKEEFKKKLDEKEFEALNPSLIEDIIPLEKIEEYIDNAPFSKHCKKNLCGFSRAIEMLKRDNLPIARTIMIVGNENLAKIKKVVMSVLIGNGLCSNILYNDLPKRNLKEKISAYGNSFVELPLEDSSYDKYQQIEAARFNFKNTFLLFCGGRKFADSYLENDGHLFSFCIQDEHSLDEKYNMVSKMCKEFGVDLLENEEILSLETLGFLSLKQQTYKLLIKCIMEGDSNKKILLSDIIEAFDVKTSTEENRNTEKNEVSNNSNSISYKDIIGLDLVKKQIGRLAKYLKKNSSNISSRHMTFLGNPGTGKTTMARCLQQELYEKGVIKKNIFVETDRGGLCGRYVGETAQKTKKVFNSAKGGVLFVDEAYALTGICDESNYDYGFEAITTLVKLMEDNRESTIVIFAGYPNEMKKMLALNPGLDSRIQFHLNFPDYTTEELEQLFIKQLEDCDYTITDKALCKAKDMFESDRQKPYFANGRYIRNFVEKLLLIQCDRSEDKEIAIEDITQYLSEEPKQEEKQHIGFCCG